MKENSFRQELLQQARALVFNSGSDAAALAFRGAEGEGQSLQGLDLTALSSIHRMANGSVELKFIDRIKLIELLLSAGDDARRGAEDGGFIQALDRAARRLGAETGAAEADGAEARDADGYAAGELDLDRERGASQAGESSGGGAA